MNATFTEKMNIARFEFNLFSVNTYIVWDPMTLHAAVIDPGMENSAECDTLSQFIEKNKLKITAIIATHLHIDHAIGINYIKTKFNVPLYASIDDAFIADMLPQQATFFHFRTMPNSPVTIDKPIIDGDIVNIGDLYLNVLAVPGHSPGSIALYSGDSHFVITGDALFNGSIGRTDLPGGNTCSLINAIRTKLLTLPPCTTIYPGHGPSSTIADESTHNPYF